MEQLNEKSSGVKFKGYIGKWYCIDSLKRGDKTYLLFESEKYGDIAPNICADTDGNVISDDSYDSLDIVLDDNGIY